MPFEQKKLDLDTYFIDRTLTFSSPKVFYIREQEVPDDIIFAKFSFPKRDQPLPDAILFAKAPFFQFMKKVYVYSDEKRQHKYFSIIQRRFAFPHRYVVRDEQDVIIGFIETKSLIFNRIWRIIDNQGIEIGSLKENLGDNIREEFRLSIQKSYSFSFFLRDQIIGDIEITADHYSMSHKFILNIMDDPEKKLDRRLALAFVFLVDDVIGIGRRC